MGRISFEKFGRYATRSDNTIHPPAESWFHGTGRHPGQKEAIRRIVPDIVHKLDIRPQDCCLEIGCGMGYLLVPISFLVESITGIDHPAIIEKLSSHLPGGTSIELHSGNFLDISLNDQFNKIIIYSVLHYMTDEDEVTAFIDKALQLLRPGGKLFLGDIPNDSRKKRFLCIQLWPGVSCCLARRDVKDTSAHDRIWIGVGSRYSLFR